MMKFVNLIVSDPTSPRIFEFLNEANEDNIFYIFCSEDAYKALHNDVQKLKNVSGKDIVFVTHDTNNNCQWAIISKNYIHISGGA